MDLNILSIIWNPFFTQFWEFFQIQIFNYEYDNILWTSFFLMLFLFLKQNKNKKKFTYL